MQHNSYRRWITLAIISFSGGVSFDLAYLRYIYQIPMAKFMGFSNTEIGLIMSTFGIALYSGRLCDNDDFNAVVGVD